MINLKIQIWAADFRNFKVLDINDLNYNCPTILQVFNLFLSLVEILLDLWTISGLENSNVFLVIHIHVHDLTSIQRFIYYIAFSIHISNVSSIFSAFFLICLLLWKSILAKVTDSFVCIHYTVLLAHLINCGVNRSTSWI